MSERSGGRAILVLLLLGLALVLVLPLAAISLVVMAATSCQDETSTAAVDMSTIPAGPIAGYGRDELVVAAQIMIVAQQLGLTVRDQQIGVMTAMGESSLMADPTAARPNGDGDVGPFQQRTHLGWYADGSSVEANIAQLNDPAYAARTFFLGHDVGVPGPSPAGPVGYHIPGLVDVPGRESLEPTDAAHRVQGNADPGHYTTWWTAAVEVVTALAGVRAVATPGTPSGTVDDDSLGPVQPQTAALAHLLGPRFGITDIGGVREDSVPDHPSGLALDFMVYRDRATGDRLAAYIVGHAREFDVQYLIWQQRIWNIDRADEGWRAMEDRGSDTANHKDHVHVTMKASGTVTDPGAAAEASSGCALTAPGTSTVDTSSSGWAAPVDGPLSSPFGHRTDPLSGRSALHGGQDIAASCDAPIHAAADGIVSTAGAAASYGHLIVVDHGGGLQTAYAHMYADGVLVTTGQTVTAGQQIGVVGSDGRSTGCHLHFEVRDSGTRVDPIPVLAQHGITYPH
ncbi:M23 family metallopeptidase [Propionicicella superfundia]|uniref:M23 family metallopeptidase n=1 Tax=Propionicicella superfundia TaxID=348582 RepID=UPI000415DB18|nr:M23 family metallopeptidase [Propionicicella superfundia]